MADGDGLFSLYFPTNNAGEIYYGREIIVIHMEHIKKKAYQPRFLKRV